MDETRNIRFITPAFFFLGNLFVGAWFANPNLLDSIKTLDSGTVAAIAAALVAAMFPIGFIITGLSTIFLRAGFRIFRGHCYQIRLSDEAWTKVWSVLRLSPDVPMSRANKIIAAATFDHEILEEGTHAWAVRSWSAFNVSVNSCTALVAATLIGHFEFGIRFTCEWLSSTACLLVLFTFSAVIIWREHMNLLELQSHRIKDGKMPNKSPEQETSKRGNPTS